MNQLSRTILVAVAVAATAPALLATPAAAAPVVTTTTISPRVLAPLTSSTLGICRILPRICGGTAARAGDGA